MKIFKFILPFLFVFSYAQQRYFVVTIDKFDSSYPKENQRFFWIIDTAEPEVNIHPLYFLTVDEDMKNRCAVNHSIGVFNRLENDLDNKLLESISAKIYDNRILQLTSKNKFKAAKRNIKYNVYTTSISTNKLFQCNLDKEEGEKINYQGTVYFIDKDIQIDGNFPKNDLDKLEAINLLNFRHIKTNPYERIVFK